MKLTGKIAGTFALITAIIGLITSPAITGLLPASTSAIIIAIGAGWGAFTDALHKPAN